MGSELLLELGCEEIPARFLGPALKQLREKSQALLAKARIGFGEAKTFGTPRRLALAVFDVAERQEEGEEKKSGPLLSQAFDEKGEPTRAALGFAKFCGVEVKDLGREQTPKGEKLCYVRKIPGRPTSEVLAEILPELVRSLDFPKAMRWGQGEVAFIRPVHWVVAILGSKVIEFELFGLRSGNRTRGHRFTHPREVEVESVADYLEKLDMRNVVPDPEFRRELIEKEVTRKAEALSGELYPAGDLLEEVTNLVEFPVVIAGRFEEKYLSLPAEVLVSAMRAHQRYFAVRKPGSERELMPYFITVANTPARDLEVVVHGNERVLAARLADAEFYFQEDLKTGIEKMREASAGMIFYQSLGTYLEKSERVAEVGGFIADKLFPGEAALRETVHTAGRFCKADLVSQMVSEFPDLQGIMGGEYAKAAGFSREVAQAIREHYLPRSFEDIAGGKFPSTPAGDVLSMADKLDSVVAGWAAGLAPTGAGDPFSLRRQGQGVINLVLAKGYRLNLPEVVKYTARIICAPLKKDEAQITREVLDFLLQRFRVQLVEGGFPYDVVDACLVVWNGDLVDTKHKIEALSRFKTREDFEPLMIAFRRVMNIIEGEPGPVDTDLFSDQSEATLYSEYTRVRYRLEPLLNKGAYDQALEVMRSLKPSVDGFFDGVLVNTEDPALRRNRHALCAAVAGMFKQIADFSRIVIDGERK